MRERLNTGRTGPAQRYVHWAGPLVPPLPPPPPPRPPPRRCRRRRPPPTSPLPSPPAPPSPSSANRRRRPRRRRRRLLRPNTLLTVGSAGCQIKRRLERQIRPGLALALALTLAIAPALASGESSRVPSCHTARSSRIRRCCCRCCCCRPVRRHCAPVAAAAGRKHQARAFPEDVGLLKRELHCAQMDVSEQQELGPTSWHACLQRWHLRYKTCARQFHAAFFSYLVPNSGRDVHHLVRERRA